MIQQSYRYCSTVSGGGVGNLVKAAEVTPGAPLHKEGKRSIKKSVTDGRKNRKKASTGQKLENGLKSSRGLYDEN